MAEIKSVPRTSSPVEKDAPLYDVSDGEDGNLDVDTPRGLHRNLSGRQIQMITIGGSIGTALFVSIGTGLVQGGPGSLLIAFTLYSCWLALVNNCMAEMAVFMPVSGGFVRMGSKWVDEAFGFMLGWNFFLYGELSQRVTRPWILSDLLAEAVLIPWEISALNLVLTFWRDDIPLAAVCAGCIVLYGYMVPPRVNRTAVLTEIGLSISSLSSGTESRSSGFRVGSLCSSSCSFASRSLRWSEVIRNTTLTDSDTGESL